MDPASEKQKWHDWAADKIADVGDGFTSEFMKLSDEEVRDLIGRSNRIGSDPRNTNYGINWGQGLI